MDAFIRWSERAIAAFLCLHAGQISYAQASSLTPVPIENYAVTHIFAHTFLIDTRNMAMGGAYVGENRQVSAGSPASLVAINGLQSNGFYQIASFRGLPAFHTVYWDCIFPIDHTNRSALKIAYLRTEASGAVPGLGIPLRLTATEEVPILSYARRVNHKLAIGIEASNPTTQSSYNVAGLGQITRLKSRPSSAFPIVNGIYEINQKIALGILYRNVYETVKQDSPVVGFPSNQARFHTTDYHIGTALKSAQGITCLFDYEQLRFQGGSSYRRYTFNMLGAEYQIRRVFLRLGESNNKLSGGIGIKVPGGILSYAFTNRYVSNLPRYGAKTAHSLQFTKEW